MSLTPSAKVSTVATLQPFYFTSELFVTNARADIENLLTTFEHLAEDEPEPFAVFKRIWAKEGWNHAHLFVWEDNAREQYLYTMFGLFLERLNEEEEELIQAGAIFGLWILFKMQLAVTALYRVQHVRITIDTLDYLATLARTSTEFHQPYIICILQNLLSGSHLDILPSSKLNPQNPTIMPHSYIVRNEEGPPAKQIGKGGKTRIELDRNGRRKWQMLNTWVDERAGASASLGEQGRALPSEERYQADKAAVLALVSESMEISAEEGALMRLKALANDSTTASEGVDRLERMQGEGARILRSQWQSANL